MSALSGGDPVTASAWIGTEVPELEGDDVAVSAELSDVDEVAIVVCDPDDEHGTEWNVLIHLSRIQAIALAGQLAAAATRSQVDLPFGHGSTGPLA